MTILHLYLLGVPLVGVLTAWWFHADPLWRRCAVVVAVCWPGVLAAVALGGLSVLCDR